MGLRCVCGISVEICPVLGIVDRNNNVDFLVNVMEACENCTVSCALSPADAGRCLLTSPEVTIPAEIIPVGPGVTPVTAIVFIQSCPITVTVTVTCLDEFGGIVCSDSAECTISRCVA
ncbi:hypothetical protein [Neobacillus mesonae]|uniref:hypothetical protein n=1 Tax=Neobacillus mesonae TaxID=1193713 RepID=UPI002573C6A1|nr:hypothetical protein [Neobacillus mesonae]